MFAATQPDSELLETKEPIGEIISVFEIGEKTRVLWKSDFKDRVVYRVETRDGNQGLVYLGHGSFSVPQACDAE